MGTRVCPKCGAIVVVDGYCYCPACGMGLTRELPRCTCGARTLPWWGFCPYCGVVRPDAD